MGLWSLLSSLRSRGAPSARTPVVPPELVAPPEVQAPPPVADGGDAQGVAFTCNLCGTAHTRQPYLRVSNRECQSCTHCHSSLRMRSLVHALSMELFGRAIALKDFPADPNMRGLGMSDWDGYAQLLAQRFAYTNTFYHQEPRLDITDVPAHMLGQYRFLISSDVFEHIPLFGLDKAFRNARALLAPGGFFLFSVPFAKTGATQEHFPRLHDFRIVEEEGQQVLYNTTATGEQERFTDLVFHGGGGATLEMRMFSEPDLLRHLADAGFSSVQVMDVNVPDAGILWPPGSSVPIVARA